uniref:Uncharacterized protein n=1 Tax=Anguilla anguilla TaxID=7936 RepID=A0A0E9QUK2_ANGAN
MIPSCCTNHTSLCHLVERTSNNNKV